MRTIKSIFAAIVLAGASVIALSGTAQAAVTPDTNTPECGIYPVVEITDIRDTNKNFTYNSDGTVTAKFKVEGTDPNCTKDASLAVWQAPTGKQYPLSDQVFYDSATKTGLGIGTHTLTAKLPCGFWQIDLVEGADPKGIDGTAFYGDLFDPNAAHMLDTHFANTTCKETVVEKEVPVETVKTVVKTETVNTPVKSLPSTGAGSIIAGTMGLSTSAGLAINLIRRKYLGL